MALVISNYASGNDTTGNGTHATPYKTLAKSVSVMLNGDYCGLEADEPISTVVTIPTYIDYTKLNAIVGLNASGVIDGTRRKLIATGTIASLIANSATTYPWLFFGLEFVGNGILSGPVFAATTWTTGPYIINCKFDGVLSIGTGTSAWRPKVIADCEMVNTVTTGSLCYIYDGELVRCKFINCSLTTGSLVTGVSPMLEDVIINGCSATTGALVGGVSRLKNIIINDCSHSSGTSGPLVSPNAGATIQQVLFRNCTAQNAAASAWIRIANAGNSAFIEDVAGYGMVGYTNTIYNAAGSNLLGRNAPVILGSDPISDATNLIMSPSYAWRRYGLKIGEFNSLIAVI